MGLRTLGGSRVGLAVMFDTVSCRLRPISGNEYRLNYLAEV